jgi:hypothetical protein
MNSLIERDIDEFTETMAADFKVKCKGIYKNRLATTSLIEGDIDELTEAMTADFKVKCKGIYKNRLAAAKMINLTHQGPCNTSNATSKASTSGGVPPLRFLMGLRVRVRIVWLRLEEMLLI